MLREFLINLYLFVFYIIFSLFKVFPQKKKTTFVTSFGDNIFHTIKEVEKQTDDQIVILKTSQCKFNFDDNVRRLILHFETINIIEWIQSIYHLATSEKVFIDNYYGFLAVTNFKPNVVCTQLWHAAGAIKKFGLEDPSIKGRSIGAHRRFKKVYSRFNHVVVGSEKMANIFRQGFDLSHEQILRTGVPRTDFLFDRKEQERIKEKLVLDYPIINNKKVILYAPTYRDDEMNATDIPLNLKHLRNNLGDDYILMIRLHPTVNLSTTNEFPDFIIDVSNYKDVNHLLIITDILITDYSSIPFEFSLLKKPMIFLAHDLQEYESMRGFWENYRQLVPGPVIKDTNDLINIIQNDEFNLQVIQRFSEQWNQYSNGNSSERLVNTVYKEQDPQQIELAGN